MKFGEIKNIAEAASPAGLETRKILDGSLFSESDRGLLKLLKSSLGDERRRRSLLDVLESRSESPLPLSEIIAVFDKFGNLHENLRQEITEDDIKLLQFAIKYFENWFYRGKWVITPERPEKKDNENSYAHFSVPAGIINMMTKFKETDELTDELKGFNQERLADLINNIEKFASGLFSGELKKVMKPADLHGAMNVFKKSEKSVKNATGAYGNKAGDLYFLKTCLVAAEMARRQREEDSRHVFIPDTTFSSAKNEYVPFDFSGGKDPKNNSMHYPTHRIPFCKFVVEYLRRNAES